MKKTYISSLIILLFSLSAYAQIGINTENIDNDKLLYIDAAKDNPTTGIPTESQILNDISVSKSGNMGIGTDKPQTKLHIVTGGTPTNPNPQLMIEDETAAPDKVLQSDINGLARWVTYTPGAELGIFDKNGIDIPTNISSYYNTNSYISLPPGKWAVIYTLVISNTYSGIIPERGSRIYVLTSLAEGTSSTTISEDIIGSNSFGGSLILNIKGSITARCLINNTSSKNKDYYIIVGHAKTQESNITLTNIGQNTGESTFYAFRVKDVTSTD